MMQAMRNLMIMLVLLALAPWNAVWAQGQPAAIPLPATTPAVTAASRLGIVGDLGADSLMPGETLDPEAFKRLAERAETRFADLATPSSSIETLRAALAAWRERIQADQGTPSTRVTTLREQITALGAPPADGASEPDETRLRREELNAQLQEALAPGVAAEVAYRRADALIREADRILRSRDASDLLRRDPAPIDPTTWPAAVSGLQRFAGDLLREEHTAWDNPARRGALLNAAPLLIFALICAIILMWPGRFWIERLIGRIQDRLPQGWWGLLELPISLAQVALPLLALALMTTAVAETGFFGPLAAAITTTGIMSAGVNMAVTLWIAGLIFPRDDRMEPLLQLSGSARIEGRFHLTIYALAIALQSLLTPAFTTAAYGQAPTIITFPVTVLSAVLLFRLAQLLRRAAANQAGEREDAGTGFAVRLMNIVARVAMLIAIIAPCIGAAGYLGLASYLVHAAMQTLGLFAIVALLQRLAFDAYVLVSAKSRDDAEDDLLPVLVAFALVLAAIPAMLLIWGMRSADLWEYWAAFRDGFMIGETRFKPSDLLAFAIIFGLGYGLTKLVQNALRGVVLPRTRLDTGARNAIVSGMGYVGIVLAALAAISATGLDLSNLALVASALSVGIGFGLQTIVQNFVSGIILLIERPVAEGDWIEVGNVQGIVKRISVRSTRVETFDRNSVIVPNASLISGQVTNYTAFNMSGRLIVPVTLGYGVDTRKVSAILQEIAEAQPMVILNPPPAVVFAGYGSGLLNFEIRAILRDVNAGTGVRSEINHQIMERFAAEGIDLPATTREVRTFVQISDTEVREAIDSRNAREAAEPAGHDPDAPDRAGLLPDHEDPGQGTRKR